ncbi:PTH1R (predicted) [Pycnogonum litorale]
MANFSWIFMEGLYLHNLIFMAVFADHSGVKPYVMMGWGLPLPFVIAWTIVRIYLDNDHCWTSYENEAYEWILRAPITASILVNFVFFIRISMVLFKKLNIPVHCKENGFRQIPCRQGMKKWIKSTLVLVPLFGAYYVIFLIISLSSTNNKLVMLIWLYCDTSFTAFQGFLVSVLYCFVNGEVQGEIRRKYHSWKVTHTEFGTNNSFLTQTQTQTFMCRGGGGGAVTRNSEYSLNVLGEKKENTRHGQENVTSNLL